MRSVFAAALFAASVLILASPAGRADDSATPSWMKVDAGAKSVQITLVAGWNNSNGALNYNGYYKGAITVRIPAGWRVDIKFSNHDGMLPHSVLATKAYGEGNIPQQAGSAEVAINKAYSRDPEAGIMNGQQDDVPFTASDPGEFWLMCGVPPHGQQGMWIKLSIVAGLDRPGIVVAAGSEPGWK